MDSFVFCCEHCGQSIKADVSDRGAQAECPYCSKQIIIPQAKTVRITDVVPGNVTHNVIFADERKSASLAVQKNKFAKLKWKYVIVGAIAVLGPVIAYFWMASNIKAGENAKINASKSSVTYSPRRSNFSSRTTARATVVPRRMDPVRNSSINSSSSAIARTRAAVSRSVEKSPDKLYLQFIAESDKMAARLNQKFASLTPDQQKAQRVIIAKIENMKSAWSARLKYIESRNKKIAEAAKKSYDRALGETVQRQFEEYTNQKSDWGYNRKCIEFSQQLLKDFENPHLDPNIHLHDRRYNRYSGNALKAVSSGRIVREEKLFEALIRRFADPACLSGRKEVFDYSLVNYGLPRDTVQYNFDRRFEPDSRLNYDKDSLELLIYDGAIPGVRHLTQAVYSSKADAVALLLAAGVDPNAVNSEGETALFNTYRIEDGTEIRNLLLAAGADPDFRNKTGEIAQDMAVVGIFVKAWKRGTLPEIEQGLKQGVDPDMLLANGEPLLLDACKRNDLDLVKILFKYKVDPNKRGKSYYMPIATTFSYLTRNYSRNKYNPDTALEIFKFMVDNGADIGVNPIGYGGSSLPYYACSNYSRRSDSKYKELVFFLLKHSGKLKDSQWNSLLGTLSLVPADVAEEMLRVAPDGMLEKSVHLMFNSSYRKASPEVVKLLVQKNIDFNKVQKTYLFDPVTRRRESGSFPVLYVAVRSGQSADVIRELLKYGADKNWRDERGKKAADYAANEEVKRLLR